MKNKSALQSILICLFVVLAFAAYNSPARADSTTWTGGSGDWFTDANWTNHVPGPSTDAFINNGGNATINSSNASAHSLTLGLNPGDSGTVSVDGTNAALSLADPSENLGPIYVGYQDRGTLSIKNGGTVTAGFAYIGTLAGEFMTSNGAVTVDGAGSTLSVKGRLNVGGTPLTGNDGGTALLAITNGATVIVSDPPPPNLLNVWVGISGTLTGNGTIRTIGGPRKTVVHGTLGASWEPHYHQRSPHVQQRHDDVQCDTDRRGQP